MAESAEVTSDESREPLNHQVLDAGSYYGEDWHADEPPTDGESAAGRIANYVATVLPGVDDLLYLINDAVPAPSSPDAPVNEWHAKFELKMEQKAWGARHGRRSYADAVLHCAKRAISIGYGGIKTCPLGRPISASQHLVPIVWHARNQAHHWEEGELRPPARECFETLAAEVDPVFLEYQDRSMSIEILNLLQWRSGEAFSADLTTIGTR